jgi:hypothetical protein
MTPEGAAILLALFIASLYMMLHHDLKQLYNLLNAFATMVGEALDDKEAK